MPSHLKRYQTEGHHHFVTFSCYRRLSYLNDDHARTVFLEVLEQLRQRHEFRVYSYVLMPEHVHLLLSEPKLQKLSDTFRVLKGQTSRQLRGDRTQFWQSRYHDFNVLTSSRFIQKMRYIHRNPVERGLVEKPEDWEWSSYRHWLTGEAGLVEVESKWTWQRREHASPPHSSR